VEGIKLQTLRLLSGANFAKALKEIPPSASESLGSLSSLRKWNEEFGEGGKTRRRQMWGKDLFGFGDVGKAGATFTSPVQHPPAV
jgi:hypothetical protein